MLLAQPGRIGAMKLKNRVVMAPMGTNYSTTDGLSTERDRQYYAERARGAERHHPRGAEKRRAMAALVGSSADQCRADCVGNGERTGGSATDRIRAEGAAADRDQPDGHHRNRRTRNQSAEGRDDGTLPGENVGERQRARIRGASADRHG